ncbi:MAG: hypothetical protein IJ191_03985 [Treponema sp.]|nr:hypothetical protein [Treponema sp.]
MAGATKVYEIADEVAITSKGVVLTEGTEVTADDFLSEEVFNTLVKAKKIVEVTKSGTSAKKNASATKNNEPASSTGAAEPGTEDTTPKKDAGKGSEDDSDKGVAAQ